MRTKRWLPPALSLARVVLSPPTARGQDSDWDTIHALNERAVAMIAADDLDGIAAMYADDARLMPPNAPLVYGREAIRDAWRPMLDVSLLTFAPETIVVSESGDMAVDVGAYHMEIPGPGGATVSDDGKYVVVWIKEDGAWRIFAHIFNSDMPLE